MIYQFRLKNSELVEFNSEHCKIIIHRIHGATEELTLARAESRILELLLMDAGAICSREAILEFAWDDRVVSAGSLNQSIFMLRNILGDGKDHEIVITVPRRGYRFNSDYVVPQAETEAEQAPAQPAPEPSAPPAAVIDVAPAKKAPLGIALPLGYMAAALFAIFSIWRLYVWYEPVSELNIAVIQHGELSISAVGKSQTAVDALKSEVLSLNMSEENLNGQIFISRTGSRINLSCIRKTGKTYNLEFQVKDEALTNMLKKCVSGE